MSADFPSNQRKERFQTPIDVQERTLKVTNYDRNVTESLLRELFSQVRWCRHCALDIVTLSIGLWDIAVCHQ